MVQERLYTYCTISAALGPARALFIHVSMTSSRMWKPLGKQLEPVTGKGLRDGLRPAILADGGGVVYGRVGGELDVRLGDVGDEVRGGELMGAKRPKPTLEVHGPYSRS